MPQAVSAHSKLKKHAAALVTEVEKKTVYLSAKATLAAFFRGEVARNDWGGVWQLD